MFADRDDAGRRLAALVAERLAPPDDGNVVVVGLPRGGVPVAAVVAAALHAPLDVVLVRKLGLPDQPEVAMGAVGEGGVEVVDRDLLWRAGVSAHEVAAVVRAEREALRARAERLREHRPGVSLAGRTVVIVDDGVATGATARAACRVARARGAARVVVAVPVVVGDCSDELLGADALLCVEHARHLGAVGQAYEDFSAVSDRECARLLDAGRGEPAGHGPAAGRGGGAR